MNPNWLEQKATKQEPKQIERKVCPLCDTANDLKNSSCFTCGWHGSGWRTEKVWIAYLNWRFR